MGVMEKKLQFIIQTPLHNKTNKHALDEERRYYTDKMKCCM